MSATGRRASITEDADALVMTCAAASDGELPGFADAYVLDALIVSGWVDPARPDVLTGEGLTEARRWIDIKAATAAAGRRGGPLSPHET